MKSETRQCQNCQKDFTIESEDFNFYEKIKVPPPTFCPECRMMRRMTYRNERTLYKRICDLCGQEKISIYSPSCPFVVYCFECFYSDKWDQLACGKKYDFSKSFFQQYFELMLKAPKLGLQMSSDLVNSEYGNHIASCKNCFLIFASVNNEDCMYCTYVSYSKNSIDCLRVFKSELCFECVDCQNCNKLNFSQQCQDCLDGYFIYNCKGCSNCFMCSGLIHKSYCVRNKQYSKEDYNKIVNSIDLSNRAIIDQLILEFSNLKEKTLRRSVEGFNHPNSTGNYLKNTKNCKQCFDLTDGEDCKYIVYGNQIKDTRDAYGAYPKTELCYETVGTGAPSYNCRFSYLPWTSQNISYSINILSGSSNCFGCHHIRSVNYCILNKQYTKEDYEKLVPKIIENMNDMPYIDRKGRIYKYGEFFPSELSPFAYNETIAQEYFPLNRDEALKQGYKWKDEEERNYAIDIKYENIPDRIKEISKDIVGKVIECGHKKSCNEKCTKAFKITDSELKFYKKMNFPLPYLCPNCRHYQRLKQRNPLKLWHRTCMCGSTGSPSTTANHFHGAEKCEVEFETSYAPDRPEIVYCEKCYQQEVY